MYVPSTLYSAEKRNCDGASVDSVALVDVSGIQDRFSVIGKRIRAEQDE